MTPWVTCARRQPDPDTLVRWQLRHTLCRATTLAMAVTFAVVLLANVFDGVWTITPPGKAVALCGGASALWAYGVLQALNWDLSDLFDLLEAVEAGGQP